MSIRFRYVWFKLTVFVSWICIAPLSAQGDEPAKATLSPEIKVALSWLPADTDTLQVAQSFSMLDPAALSVNNNSGAGPVRDFRYLSKMSALEGLWELESGKYLAPLAGRKVIVALRGSRNVDVVSNFGSLRSEGCAVVVFEQDLGDAAKEWTNMLRQDARQTKQLVGHDVFVFDSTTVMEGWVKPKPWQGTFLVLLTSRTLLCATSDEYLEEVLRNLDTVPVVRALPGTLPEWQHMDTAAPGWMLRHVPEKDSRRTIIGLTLTATKDRCRIVYLPLAGQKQDAKEFIRNRWLGKDPIVDLAIRYEFERPNNGTIVVSAGSNAFELENSLLIWHIYYLAGER